MDSKSGKLQFSIGQPVVYPQQGLGIIKDIRERAKDGQTIRYYAIYLEPTDMTLLDEAQKAINSMSSRMDPVPADWKLRYQKNQDLIRSGTIGAIAKVVQSLYHRSKIKELPVQERKLYDNALCLLIDEASYAMKKDKEEISTLIFSKLEK